MLFYPPLKTSECTPSVYTRAISLWRRQRILVSSTWVYISILTLQAAARSFKKKKKRFSVKRDHFRYSSVSIRVLIYIVSGIRWISSWPYTKSRVGHCDRVWTALTINYMCFKEEDGDKFSDNNTYIIRCLYNRIDNYLPMADEGLSGSEPLCISVGLAPSIDSGWAAEPAAPARPSKLADAVTGGPGSPGWGIIGMGGAWPACGSCCACICCWNRKGCSTYVLKCPLVY